MTEATEAVAHGGAAPSGYVDARRALLSRPGPPGPGRRRELSDLTDAWLTGLVDRAAGAREGIALVAVGGYGRRQLSPGSDLDLLLLSDGRRDGAAVASRIWYPIWDAGVRLDHSVRSPEEARDLARTDLAVVLGLLDARTVAGDVALLPRVREAVLADWRSRAAQRLPELRAAAQERAARAGDAAHVLEPDLKDARGGLRDVVVLRAAVASWVVDRPHGGLDTSAARLLDVRDALHLVTGRSTDKLVLQEQDAVAGRLGMADADSVLRVVHDAARSVAYAADVTWREVDLLLGRRRRRFRVRTPQLRPVGAGLLEHDGELVLAASATLLDDPVLPLRAAAAAASGALVLGAATATRLAQVCPALPVPWPAAARDALVTLLGAGAATVPVWEALDQAGLPARWLPGWELVRSRPQRTPVHRFTVDRHSVECAVQCVPLARDVSRPDLLLLGALLHDIGKGQRRGDHSVVGARTARVLAERMGLVVDDVATVELLVREHLTLVEAATRRDLDDPATAARVAAAVGSRERLDLLAALTQADAVAAGPAAWTPWRAGLVRALVERVRGVLAGASPVGPAEIPAAQRALAAHGALSVQLERVESAWAVTVVAPDQRGLLAAVAGVLALHRLSVRSATMRTDDGVAVDVWHVEPEYGDEPTVEALREDIRRALDRSIDVADLLARREEARRQRVRPSVAAQPRVDVVAGASATATVLEVRTTDRLGLLHRFGRALSIAGTSVRAARATTLGSEVLDVFYVVDEDGRPLRDERAREVARILKDVAG